MTHARALLLETLCRRRLVALVHVLFLISYAALFLLFLLPEYPPLNEYMFIATGLFLPLALSAGIFGNDIANGRFRVLATEPLPLGAYYLWRVAGLVLQGAAHVLALSGAALLLHAWTGKGDVQNLARWAFATFALYTSVAAFSTTLSVVAKAEANSPVACLLPPLFLLLDAARRTASDPFWLAVCDKLLAAGRYGLPPVELLARAADAHLAWGRMAGCALHALGLTLLYAVAGVTLLERRSYRPQRS